MAKPVSLSEGVLMTTDGPVSLGTANIPGLTGLASPSIGSGSGDIGALVNAAMVTAAAAGGGDVVVAPGSYVNTIPWVPKSGVRLKGYGVTISTSFTGSAIGNPSGTLTDFTVQGFIFLGSVNQVVTGPQRSRTTSGAGIDTAISLKGDLNLADAGGPFPAITNVVLHDIKVRNCSSLPIRITGIRGVTRVTNSEFTNCMDVGFTYCQEVILIGNHSYMSADNGFSISQGCEKLTCVGNTVEMCCYGGIWVSGFTVTTGPRVFTINGNSIKNVGVFGLMIQDAPIYGTIVGNSIDQGHNQGGVSEPSDRGCGIWLRGDSTTPTTPAHYVLGLVVADNLIYHCPRIGIYYDGLQNAVIQNNLILDTGVDKRADGTTTILAADTAYNIGILSNSPTTNTDVIIRNNHVTDTRGTPYCNWGVQPMPAPAGTIYSGNTMTGCRNASNLGDLAGQSGGVKTYTGSGSYTTPNGVSLAEITAVGAGGGGGGAGAATGATLQKGGGGGGAGAIARQVVAVTPALVLTVTIGAGGTAGTAGAAPGGAGGAGGIGGTTSVIGSGVTVSVGGGTGGLGSAGNSTASVNGGVAGPNGGTADGRWAGAGGASTGSAGPPLGSAAGGGGGGSATSTLGGGGGLAGSMTIVNVFGGASGASGTAAGVAGFSATAADYGCGGGGGGGGAAGTGAGGLGGVGGAGWVMIRPVG